MLLAAIGLTACTGDADPDVSPVALPTAVPTATHEIPDGFIECDGRPPKDGELVADVDLTTLTAPAPTGFEEIFSGYYEDHPVEGDHDAQYWVPLAQQASLDIINLVVYPQMDLGPLTVTCDQIAWRDITERIAEYHELNGATIVEETSQTSVAGLPAVREVVDLPGSGYSYIGYWIFGRGQVAHLYCQWVDDEATISAGCEEWIATVTVS